MNPLGLNAKNCRTNLQIDADKIYLNQEVVENQLQTAYINVINSFLTKYDSNFLGKAYNMADCPPGFEGPLCTPCEYGTFKPFYGSRECVTCPCTMINLDNNGNILILRLRKRYIRNLCKFRGLQLSKGKLGKSEFRTRIFYYFHSGWFCCSYRSRNI